MKKWFISMGLIGALALTGFGLTGVEKAEASGYTFTQEEQEALNYINKKRQDAGVAPLALDPYLTKAAQNHASYLNINGLLSHDEIKGKKGFTGESIDDRIQAVGGFGFVYTSEGATSSSEVLTYPKFIERQVNAPYHRGSVLNPNYNKVGFGKAGGKYVLKYGGTVDTEVKQKVRYPFNGQTNVPVSFYGASETPNPLSHLDIETSGFIITYRQSDSYDYGFITQATLKDSKGNNVPINYGEYIVGIIPLQVLKSGEKYTVSLTFTHEMSKVQEKDTWSFTTAGTSTTPAPTPTPKPTPTPTIPKFADFKTGQYWSEPMMWMINKGLIQGYTEKNKKTGKVENLIKPTTTLTEAQFLAILYRYKGIDKDIKSTNTKDWANVYYQQAKRDGLPTKGTLTNRSAGNQPILRGKMAQLMASKHYGKAVTTSTAVSFMYKESISDGYTVNGKSPKTYASFGVNDKLQRAHIAAFMQRYDKKFKK